MSFASIKSLLRSATFRLALIYMVLFSVSALVLLSFIYWSTAAYMSRQVDATIDAEITGLAERYETDGLRGLTAQVGERLSKQQPGDSTVYLLTDNNYRPLLGNINRWPQVPADTAGWVTFRLGDDVSGRVHSARARAFLVRGRYHLLVGRDMYELQSIQTLIKRTLVLGGVFTFALALLGGFMMSRSVNRRLDTINRASREIMSGNLNQRIPHRGSGDEFDQLSDNLNNMLDQIEALMDGVRRVSDNIAHDLRTPLARLRNRLESLSMQPPGDDQARREMVEQALAEADGLLGTFNALLRIARLEADARRAGFAPLELGQVLADVVELYEPVAEENRQRVELVRESEFTLVGDRDLLFQAFTNLLDNAVKYTPPEGLIRARVYAAGVSVCDSGPGVPEREKDKVFQRFYRVDSSRSTPGSGLGLSLVKAVASLHDLRVRLTDADPGLCVVLEPVAADSAPLS
jgi:signal transduction histidine kinase